MLMITKVSLKCCEYGHSFRDHGANSQNFLIFLLKGAFTFAIFARNFALS
jgi:hypothetical protein